MDRVRPPSTRMARLKVRSTSRARSRPLAATTISPSTRVTRATSISAPSPTSRCSRSSPRLPSTSPTQARRRRPMSPVRPAQRSASTVIWTSPPLRRIRATTTSSSTARVARSRTPLTRPMGAAFSSTASRWRVAATSLLRRQPSTATLWLPTVTRPSARSRSRPTRRSAMAATPSPSPLSSKRVGRRAPISSSRTMAT